MERQEALRRAAMRTAVVEDRARIARDLHDTVIQRLFGAGLSLQAAASMTEGALRDRLEAVVGDLDEMIFDLRTTIFSLQGTRTLAGGLRGELLDAATEAGLASGLDVRVQFDGPIESLDDRVAPHLLPVLRGVGQRGQARPGHRAACRWWSRTWRWSSPTTASCPDEVFGGSGLANLAARAEELGGTSSLVPGPDGGSVLEWRVPRT